MLLVQIDANDKATVKLKNLGKQSNKTKVELLGVGDVLTKVFGAAALYVGVRRVGDALMYAAKNANEYQLALKKIEVIGEVASNKLTAFDIDIKNLAKTTEFGATAIAQGALEVIKMGASVDQTKEILPNALNLATFAGEDFMWTAQNMMNVMKAFQIETTSSAYVSDVMATALNKTSLNLKGLMEGYTYSAAIASNLNYSFEETTALLGFLSDIGIKGSLSGTSLKNAMLKLLDPTESVAGALKNVNMSGMRLVDILELLDKSGLSVQQMLKQFDLRALPAALAIGDNAERIKDLINILDGNGEITGAAKRGAEEIRKAYALMWKKLQNVFELSGVAINEAFGTAQGDLIDVLILKITEFTDYVIKNKTEIQSFSKKAIDVLSKALDWLSVAIKAASDHWRLFLFGLGLAAIGKLTIFMISLGKAITGTATSLLTLNAGLSATVKITSVIKNFNLILLAVEGLAIGITTLIEKWDQWLDRTSEKFSTTVHTPEMLKRVSEIRDAYISLNKEKERYGDVSDFKLDMIGDSKYREAKLYLESLKAGFKKDFNAPLLVKDFKATDMWYQNMNKYIPKSSMTFDPLEVNPKPIGAGAGAGAGAGTQGDLGKWLTDLEAMSNLETTFLNLVKDAKEGEIKSRLEAIDVEIEGLEKIRDAKLKYIEESKQKWDEYNQMIKEEQLWLVGATADAFVNGSSLFMTISDVKTQRTIDNLNLEMSALEERYAKEDSLAQEQSAIDLAIEKKRTKERKKIQDELDAKKEEMAKRDAKRRIIEATANALVAGVNTLAQSPGSGWGRIAQAMAVFALATQWVDTLVSASSGYRDGTDNFDNETSDSRLAKVSKGEMIVRARDVKKAGGPDKIRGLINRNPSSGRGEITVNIESFYGSRTFVREIASTLKEELRL